MIFSVTEVIMRKWVFWHLNVINAYRLSLSEVILIALRNIIKIPLQQFKDNKVFELDDVAHAFNSTTRKGQSDESLIVPGHSNLQGKIWVSQMYKTLPQKKKERRK